MFSRLLIPAFWWKELRQNKTKKKTENISIYGETELFLKVSRDPIIESLEGFGQTATKRSVVGYIFHIAFQQQRLSFSAIVNSKHISGAWSVLKQALFPLVFRWAKFYFSTFYFGACLHACHLVWMSKPHGGEVNCCVLCIEIYADFRLRGTETRL